MKIISKFKDFYDFVAGYDTDPRKVFVRKMEFLGCGDVPALKGNTLKAGQYEADLYFLGEVWFCDQHIPYFKDISTGLFYYDYNEIPDTIRYDVNNLFMDRHWHHRVDNGPGLEIHFGVERSKRKWGHEDAPVRINTKHKQPIFFSHYADYGKGVVVNGRLADIRFSQFKSPQDTFTELYNWIPFIEPDMPSDPTDMSRFENKGFDKKTSFRH